MTVDNAFTFNGAVTSYCIRHQLALLVSTVDLSNLLSTLLGLGSRQGRNGFLAANLTLWWLIVRHLQCRCSCLLPVWMLVPVLRLGRLGQRGTSVLLQTSNNAIAIRIGGIVSHFQ